MTKILDLTNEQNYIAFLQEAGDCLKNGGIIAFPTETVYGFGVNANDSSAIARLYKVKQRPIEKKLTTLIADKSEIRNYVEHLSLNAEKLIEMFWPGPLTLVLPCNGGGYIGLRMPKYKVVSDLLGIAKIPIVAPSANISGQPPMTNAISIYKVFKNKIDLILDYGSVPIGKASTVVQVNGNEIDIVRQGAIIDKEIYDCIAL